MPWPKGRSRPKPPGSGRKPGSPNKTTTSVKEAITQAFDGLGGVPALIRWGTKNPHAFYPLWARLAPAELNVRAEGFDALAEALRLAEARAADRLGVVSPLKMIAEQSGASDDP